MIRKGFLFIASVFLLTSFQSEAQDAQFSQYYAAPLYLNPGLAGINQKGRMGINYRSQWPNLDANFQTFSAYIDAYLEDQQSAIGFIVTRDREGIVGLSSTNIGLQYAYQLQINYNWVFRPGIEASYVIRDLNFDKLTFGDQFDESGLVRDFTIEDFDTGLSTTFFDLSFGGLFYNPRAWLGGAVHHVTQPNQAVAGGESPLYKRISVHGGYRIPLAYAPGKKYGRGLTPTFSYKAQGDFDQLDLGAYFDLNPLLVGFWYRGLPIKNLDGIVNNESIIVMLGLQSRNTTFGYSFDYTISGLGIGTGGAHEISITHTFKLNDKPDANVRRLRCPIPFIF